MNSNYVNYLVSQKKSEKTIAAYTKNIEKMLSYVGKSEDKISAMDLMNWQSSMSDKASSSINQAVASVKSYFRFLNSFGVLNFNPSTQLVPPTIKNREKQFISEQMVKDMLAHCRTIRDKAMILVMITTGLRQAEIASLTTKQYLDMKAAGKNTLKSIGKGDKENLVILNEQTMAAIDEYLKQSGTNHKWLFASRDGAQLLDNNMNYTLKTTAKRAGIPFWNEISCHYLRAGCATIMAAKGVHISLIQKTMHHERVATTMRYIKTNEAQLANAAAIMTF